MPVKAKHFPTYWLVSATLWNEHINVLIHRQKGLSLKVLLANSWVFRLSLIETLRVFFIFLLQVIMYVSVLGLCGGVDSLHCRIR